MTSPPLGPLFLDRPVVTGEFGSVRQALRAPADPQTYRNFLYLVLGLPLGTIWFTLIVTVVAVGVGLTAVALIGIPVVLGWWYLIHALAAIERSTTKVLLGHPMPSLAPIDHGDGNPWDRLRHVSTDAARWRELRYLLLRFPVGIATFAIAVSLPTIAVSIVWTPFHLRRDDHDWGTWPFSTTLENLGTSDPWSWLFVPAGLLFALVSLHVMNRIAGICGRWTARAIGDLSGTPASTPHFTNFDGVEAIWRRGVPGVVTDEDEIDADNG